VSAPEGRQKLIHVWAHQYTLGAPPISIFDVCCLSGAANCLKYLFCGEEFVEDYPEVPEGQKMCYVGKHVVASQQDIGMDGFASVIHHQLAVRAWVYRCALPPPPQAQPQPQPQQPQGDQSSLGPQRLKTTLGPDYTNFTEAIIGQQTHRPTTPASDAPDAGG